MRRWIIKILLLVLLCAATTAYNEIVWNSEAKLGWSDFGARPAGGHFAALTASGISYSYTAKQYSFEVEVYAVFDKDESWVDRDVATASLLVHEQLHFDITELWARKLRKAILESPNINNEVLAALYDKHLSGLVRMQHYYDEQSHHSLDKDMQDNWEKGIASELVKLADYDNAILVVGRDALAAN